MQNQYYVMRHGESTANRQGLIVSQTKHALDNYGLTNRGVEQVMDSALRTRLNSELLIVSSDFLRATESAEIVSDILGTRQPINVDERLRERDFGMFELASDDYYPVVWRQDESATTINTQQVETVDHVLHRQLSLLKMLENRYRGKTILLVGHGDPLQILLAWYHGLLPSQHRHLAALANADIRSVPLQKKQRKIA